MENEFVNPNGQDSQSVIVATRQKRPSNLWLIIVAGLFIVVPFLTWYLTWFGRGLSDQDLASYLSDEKNPRHIQHALLQVEERIERADASAQKFYPQIIAAAKSSVPEVRKTAAWVMGQDSRSAEFHAALASLLKDDEPLVRRNAALQLVRFGDASGRPELRAMLQPFEAKCPITGTIVSILPPGSPIRAGAMLARIRDSSNNPYEFRSPVDGTIANTPAANQSGASAIPPRLSEINVTPPAKAGDQITANQTLAWLTPDRVTIVDALRALAYVGTQDDLPLVQAATQMDTSAEVGNQSVQTAKSIRNREP